MELKAEVERLAAQEGTTMKECAHDGARLIAWDRHEIAGYICAKCWQRMTDPSLAPPAQDTEKELAKGLIAQLETLAKMIESGKPVIWPGAAASFLRDVIIPFLSSRSSEFSPGGNSNVLGEWATHVRDLEAQLAAQATRLRDLEAERDKLRAELEVLRAR